jgi:hypothetical protein
MKTLRQTQNISLISLISMQYSQTMRIPLFMRLYEGIRVSVRSSEISRGFDSRPRLQCLSANDLRVHWRFFRSVFITEVINGRRIPLLSRNIFSGQKIASSLNYP